MKVLWGGDWTFAECTSRVEPIYDEAVCDDTYISEVDHALEQFATSSTLLGKPTGAPSRAFGEMATHRGSLKRFDAGQLTRAF